MRACACVRACVCACVRACVLCVRVCVCIYLLFELVAGEGHNTQWTSVSVAGVQLPQLAIVSLCLPSQRGHVHDQHHLTPVIMNTLS